MYSRHSFQVKKKKKHLNFVIGLYGCLTSTPSVLFVVCDKDTLFFAVHILCIFNVVLVFVRFELFLEVSGK